jgi:hypothetical protein
MPGAFHFWLSFVSKVRFLLAEVAGDLAGMGWLKVRKVA